MFWTRCAFSRRRVILSHGGSPEHQEGIGADIAAGTQFAFRLVGRRQGKLGVDPLLVLEEIGRRGIQVVERSLDLGHLLVEVHAALDDMLHHQVVADGRTELHHQEHEPDDNEGSDKAVATEEELRQMQSQRLRGVLVMYICLHEFHGVENRKITPERKPPAPRSTPIRAISATW